MHNRITLALLALLAAVPAAEAAISDPVRTDGGQISCVTLKSGVRTFKGIPFAKPPVGDLRWREAMPPDKWSGVEHTELKQSRAQGEPPGLCLTIEPSLAAA
jgi:para-nitrobenzyl esterase